MSIGRRDRLAVPIDLGDVGADAPRPASQTSLDWPRQFPIQFLQPSRGSHVGPAAIMARTRYAAARHGGAQQGCQLETRRMLVGSCHIADDALPVLEQACTIDANAAEGEAQRAIGVDPALAIQCKIAAWVVRRVLHQHRDIPWCGRRYCGEVNSVQMRH